MCEVLLFLFFYFLSLFIYLIFASRPVMGQSPTPTWLNFGIISSFTFGYQNIS